MEIRGPSTQKPVRLEVRRAIRVLIFQGFQVTIEYVVFVSSLLVLSDREFWSYLNKCAGVMELVDVADSKASKSGSVKSDKNLDFSRLPRYNKI